MRKILLIVAAIFATSACVGCGESMPASVSGKVSMDGQPLTSGTIAFHPVSKGTIGYGTIDSSGRYQLSTGTSSGVEPGEYTATVAVTGPPVAQTGKADPIPQLLSPPKYASKQSSDLRFSVNQGSNKINLELKSR